MSGKLAMGKLEMIGGQLIATHVEAVLGIASGRGSRYFRGFGKETREKWSEFVNLLEAQVPESEAESAIHGARKMFAAFGQWMSGID
jgi:heme oxygenase